jgi:hypothetical protein
VFVIIAKRGWGYGADEEAAQGLRRIARTMYQRNDRTFSIHTPGASQRARGRLARLPARTRLAVLAALASLTLAALLAAPTGLPARAAPGLPALLSCNGPCVGITNPLYPTNGQLVAEGPVGALLTVEGANWPPSTLITIWPAPDADTCAQQQAQPPSYAGTIPVNVAGNASGPYTWPKAANSVNQTYILCAVDGSASVSPDVQSNGITQYIVLAAAAPSLKVAPSNITQGQDSTLTISGQNWLPQQALTVTICSDAHCSTSPIANQTTASAQDGTFQITLTIKGDIAPGSYYVLAVTANGALKAPPGNAPAQLTINTPTPTPTSTPSPTPTPTPTPTPPNSGKGNTLLLVVLLGMLAVVFLVGGIISLAIYMRGQPEERKFPK